MGSASKREWEEEGRRMDATKEGKGRIRRGGIPLFGESWSVSGERRGKGRRARRGVPLRNWLF